MDNINDGFTAFPFPRSRQLILDAGWMGKRKHMMHGFIEVDVTKPRCLIEEKARQSGEKLSFSAFLLTCVGRAVTQDKQVQAMRDWRNRLIVFDDVDVMISIEIEVDGRSFPLVHPMRAVNRRSALEIHQEIRALQNNPDQSEEVQTPFLRYFYWLPTFGRHLLYRLVEVRPLWRKRFTGTVGLTSVGMFGNGRGWGVGMPIHSLAITVGGIVEKPAWIDGRIEPRQYLCVTLSFDHNVIDGAPAARFTNTFRELVEAGYGLE